MKLTNESCGCYVGLVDAMQESGYGSEMWGGGQRWLMVVAKWAIGLC